jgi:hypothetical protein
MYKLIEPEWLHFSRAIQEICPKAFYNHPHGCPNYGMREECPPRASLIDEVLDLERELYVIYTLFEVGRFAEHIRERHPDWSNRQIYNPWYWQPVARKLHRRDVAQAVDELGLEKVTDSPEGHGVNVSFLMRNAGITLSWKWPPEHSLENITYRISLGGYAPMQSETMPPKSN